MHKPRIGIYEKALPQHLPWQERLQIAAKAGYDFIEIAIDESDERLARLQAVSPERAEIRQACIATGIPIYSIVLSAHRKYPMGSASHETREKSLEILHQAVDLAVDLGIRMIQLAGYFVFYEEHTPESEAHFVQSLDTAVKMASRAGVVLAIENMDGQDITSISDAMQYVNQIQSPWLHLYPDMGNLAGNLKDVHHELKIGANHLVGIHLKDAQEGIFRRVPFGEGIVPFAEIFKTLAELDYSGSFLIEMWNDDSPNSVAIIRDAREWVVEQMRQGGLITDD